MGDARRGRFELLRHEGLAAQIPHDLWDRGISFFARLAEEAIEAGELAPDVAPADVAGMLLAVTTGLAHFATLDQSLERHRAAVIVVERLFDGSLMSSSERPGRAAGRS